MTHQIVDLLRFTDCDGVSFFFFKSPLKSPILIFIFLWLECRWVSMMSLFWFFECGIDVTQSVNLSGWFSWSRPVISVVRAFYWTGTISCTLFLFSACMIHMLKWFSRNTQPLCFTSIHHLPLRQLSCDWLALVNRRFYQQVGEAAGMINWAFRAVWSLSFWLTGISCILFMSVMQWNIYNTQ